MIQDRYHAHGCGVGRSPSAKRTARERGSPLGAALVGGLSFRRIVFGSGDADLGEDEDRPADEEEDFSRRLSAGRSDCQSMPCWRLS